MPLPEIKVPLVAQLAVDDAVPFMWMVDWSVAAALESDRSLVFHCTKPRLSPA
jgi:hypothetical protein